jgi:hypothetical protein
LVTVPGGFARAAAEYREVLRDGSTFESTTIEDLLATPGALDRSTVEAFRERYL